MASDNGITTATYFDFILCTATDCYVLQLEMHVGLISASKFYLLTRIYHLQQDIAPITLKRYASRPSLSPLPAGSTRSTGFPSSVLHEVAFRTKCADNLPALRACPTIDQSPSAATWSTSKARERRNTDWSVSVDARRSRHEDRFHCSSVSNKRRTQTDSSLGLLCDDACYALDPSRRDDL